MKSSKTSSREAVKKHDKGIGRNFSSGNFLKSLLGHKHTKRDKSLLQWLVISYMNGSENR